MFRHFGNETLYSQRNHLLVSDTGAGLRRDISSGKSWLLFFGAAVFVVTCGMLVRSMEGPYRDKDRADPAYAYLGNALALEQGFVPFMIQHPGTTIQELGAAVIRIKEWTGRSQDAAPPTDMATRVLSNPESYLFLINDVLLAVMAAAIALATKLMFDRTGRLTLALLVPLLLVLSPSAFDSTGQVQPEPLLVVLAVLLTLVACPPTDGTSERNYGRAILFGAILGAGVVTKVTFIPLAIFIVSFSGILAILAASAACIVTMVTLLYPIWSKFEVVYTWLRSLATHQGYYGTGDEGVPPLMTLVASAEDMILSEPLIVVAILLSGVVACWLYAQSGRVRSSARSRFYLSAMLVSLAQLVLVAKHPLPRYLLPALASAAVWIPLGIRDVERRMRAKGRILVSVAVASVAALLCYMAAVRDGRRLWLGIDNAEEFSRIAFISDFLECEIIPYYRNSSSEYAIYFANYWSGSVFSSNLSIIYPNNIVFNPGSGLFENFYGSFPLPPIPSKTGKWCIVGDSDIKIQKISNYSVKLIRNIGFNSIYLLEGVK